MVNKSLLDLCLHVRLSSQSSLPIKRASALTKRVSDAAQRMPPYLAWFTITFCRKSPNEGKRFIKELGLCFREVRMGHGNTDWHTDMCLSCPSTSSQRSRLLSHPAVWIGTKRVLFSGCRMAKIPKVSPHRLQAPAVMTLADISGPLCGTWRRIPACLNDIPTDPPSH